MKLSYRLILCAISLLLFFSATDTYGQSPPGVSKFQEVETDMKSFYVALSRLSFVVGAVSGLLGGLRVYNNWQMGRHQIDV
nr:plasmid transfer protein [Algoriphagus sp.]